MLDRLEYLLMYVGSAATVAFLAASLGAPTVATFACDTSDADGEQQCRLVQTLAAAGEDGGRADAAVALSATPGAAR